MQINFQYGGSNNNNESLSNIENIPSLLNMNNKYLENMSQRITNMKYDSTKDIIKKEKNTLNFEYTIKKENNNNNNISINLHSNIDEDNFDKNNIYSPEEDVLLLLHNLKESDNNYYNIEISPGYIVENEMNEMSLIDGEESRKTID